MKILVEDSCIWQQNTKLRSECANSSGEKKNKKDGGKLGSRFRAYFLPLPCVLLYFLLKKLCSETL